MQATGVLYQSLYDAILQIAWPSSTLLNKAIAFVGSFQRKRHNENTLPEEYTDLARNYFVKKYGGKYRELIKPLLDHGIIQRTNYYRPGWMADDGEYIKGQCYSYRINPELQDDEIIKVIYKGEKRKQRCRDEVTMKSKQILRQIRIQDLTSQELIKYVKTSLTDERIRAMLKVNDEIRDSQVHIKGYDHPISTAAVRRKSKDLIKDGKYCYIEHLDVYIRRKRRHLTQAYCDQLLRLKHRNVYADRNDTNLRLDSNLTNLKSDFLSLLTIDGQRLSNVDLKNSQFRIFVYLLEQCERQILFSKGKTEKFLAEENSVGDRKWEIYRRGERIEGKPVTLLCTQMSEYCTEMRGAMISFSRDYKEFKKLVKTGKLYERIRELMWIETGAEISRSEAKKVMFGLAFSSWRYQGPEKQVLKKYFPNMIKLIDSFKKEACIYFESCPPPSSPSRGGQRLRSGQTAREAGNASFAVLLQQVESLVFVDEILAKCYKKGLKVLSKHDSIVCRQCDKHKVTKIICKVLNKLFGKWTYILDVDGEVFDLQPKRKSRIARVATTLFDQLKAGISGLGNGPPVGGDQLSVDWLNGDRTSAQLSASTSGDDMHARAIDEGTRRFMEQMRKRRNRSRDRSQQLDRW